MPRAYHHNSPVPAPEQPTHHGTHRRTQPTGTVPSPAPARAPCTNSWRSSFLSPQQHHQQRHRSSADSGHHLQTTRPHTSAAMAQTPPPALSAALFEQAAAVIVQRTDAATRKALFSLCRVGRDTVLRNAPSATLQLNTTTVVPDDDAWFAQLAAARQALLIRGRQPTTLLLVVQESGDYEGGPMDDDGRNETLLVIPEELDDACECITELRVKVNEENYWLNPYNNTTRDLSTVVAAFPYVQRISGCPFVLPEPHELPCLREVIVKFTERAEWMYGETGERDHVSDIFTSMSAFLPQLSSLEFELEDHRHEEGYSLSHYKWRDLFRAGYTSHTLHTFEINDTLDNVLLGLLITHAPALKHLSVSGLEMHNDEHAGKQWAVEKLYPGQVLIDRQFSRLPVSTAGPVVIEATECTENWQVTLGKEGLDPAAAKRLSEFKFEFKTLRLTPDPPDVVLEEWEQPPPPLHPSLHTGALRSALQQLQALQVVGRPIVELRFDSFTSEMLAVVAAAVPTLPQLQLQLTAERLTDALLGQLLGMAPHVPALRVERFGLTGTQHAAADWPWQRIHVGDTVSAAALFSRLPLPGPGQATFGFSKLVVTADVARVDETRIRAWQDRVVWEPRARDSYSLDGPTLVTITLPFSTPTALPTQVSIPQHMRLGDIDSCVDRVSVRLEDWPLTHEAMQALQNLPNWNQWLDFSHAEWPLSSVEYRSLAQHVPVSYKVWWLGLRESSSKVSEICAGLNERRAGLGLRRVVLVVGSHNAFKMMRRGEHVVLANKAWFSRQLPGVCPDGIAPELWCV